MGDQSKINDNCPESESKMAGKAEQCKGCPNAKICSSEMVIDPSIELIQNNLSHFDLILCVMSGKGGVGKSTITRNLSERFSKHKLETIIVDLDFSGPSIPKLTNTDGIAGIEINNQIEPIRVTDYLSCISVGYFIDDSNIFNSNVKTNLLKKIFTNTKFGNFKIMIIDTPPNITDEHLGLVNYIKPHTAIIITTPQLISYQDVLRQIKFCNKTNIKIEGVIENMKGFKCSKCKTTNKIFNDCNVEEKCSELGIRYLGYIDMDTAYGKLSDQGLPFECEVLDKIVQKLLDKIKN
jgi:Mrp family chromosome partitioning ATPase